MDAKIRKTSQFLIPQRKGVCFRDSYDIYPTCDVGPGRIFSGASSLFSLIGEHSEVVIDGYEGIFFSYCIGELVTFLSEQGKKVSVYDISECLKPEEEVNRLISPFIGGDDPLFGTRATIGLADFFDRDKLAAAAHDRSADISIIYGTGAALSGAGGFMIYIDLPKNELQFRARAGAVTNLGASEATDFKEMYRRFYFVDWVVLNRHKQELVRTADIFVDGQRFMSPSWIEGEVLRSALARISRNVFRVRPWFEPGPWGGDWIREHIEGLSLDAQNYAWSFELIVPENGLLFESDGYLLEVSFDTLMFLEAENVLGDCYDRYGTEFPIRFDFLDTFNGGNLSVQCHPRPDYIKEHFGENFTQEECYYILDTRNNAKVYLGFKEGADKNKFRAELEKSYSKGVTADIDKYVQSLPASVHDMFLIPCGTVHGSGKNNLVLEISTTPYIFTFKMYDWMRPDLDGKPRPLNIDRAMDNLFFDRAGSYVTDNLVSKPELIGSGTGWELFHLPTHETHSYDVHRYSITGAVNIETKGKLHVMNLVGGSSIIVETRNGMRHRYLYAETFVVPAAAESYRLINDKDPVAIVVQAFIK